MNANSIPFSLILAVFGFTACCLAIFKLIRRPSKQEISLQGKSTGNKVEPTPDPVSVQTPTDSERLTQGMSKTALFFQSALDRVLGNAEGAKFYDELEEVLLEADVGIEFAEKIRDGLKSAWGLRVPVRTELQKALSSVLLSQITNGPFESVLRDLPKDPNPRVIMVVGVNGVGKTTTVGKLCHHLQLAGRKVIVGAADTFRPAAVEQLRQWVTRVGAEGVYQKEGADPSAVAFDAIQAAVNRKFDLCLIDTAGRLHTKQNLMDELQKMKRVMSKVIPNAPHDVWLVVDGSTGQNALQQAREFNKALTLTGIIVTKLDGSAKGGVVLSIMSELKIPVLLVGVGEAAEDLIPFERAQFVESLLSAVK